MNLTAFLGFVIFGMSKHLETYVVYIIPLGVTPASQHSIAWNGSCLCSGL